MNWRLKGLIQKTLGCIPGGARVHYLLQRRFGDLRDLQGELESKVQDWILMMGYLRHEGLSLTGKRLFEIGTGWYPTFPCCCYLVGAAQMVTVDLHSHLEEDLLRESVRGIERHLAAIAQHGEVPLEQVRRRYDRLREGVAGAADLGRATGGVIRYLARVDARRTGLPGWSVDLVFSNSVLEHVPSDAIPEMFREAHRILADDGLMYHGINCGDHYAYFDPSITQLHYLRYSDAQWARWNNSFLYQNRLRAHEFLGFADAADFQVVFTTAKPSEQKLAQLRAIPVHPQFARFSPEQLCITSNDFVARKRPAANRSSPTTTAP